LLLLLLSLTVSTARRPLQEQRSMATIDSLT
jgi:hypothetical protein